MAYLGIVRKTNHEPEKLIQSVDKYWGKWSNISRIESTQDSACRILNTQDIISVVLLTRKNNEKVDKSRQTTELINSLNSACERFIISLGESHWLWLLMAKTLQPHLSMFSYEEYKVTV